MNDIFHLLPCPFCGNQPEWVGQAITDGRHRLKCNTCYFTVSDDRRDKVASLWNHRHRGESAPTEPQTVKRSAEEVLRDVAKIGSHVKLEDVRHIAPFEAIEAMEVHAQQFVPNLSLPGDEEIWSESIKHVGAGYRSFWDMGAKWMRDLMQKQINSGK